MTRSALLALAALGVLFSAATRSAVARDVRAWPIARSDAVPFRASTTDGVLTLRARGSEMIQIVASTFTMGSTPEQIVEAKLECQREPLGHQCQDMMFSNEGPVRRVSLSMYWLDRFEVTVEEYGRCVAARRCRAVPFEHGGRRFDRPDYPVSLVTWDDASRFCRFRGARLPTEAEFERAARGPSGRAYPWGNLFNSHAANHGRFAWKTTDDRDGAVELAAVGSFPAGSTPDGFSDLAGNVAEWVSDRYLPSYLPEDLRDPRGPLPPAAGSARVVRGGSFQSGAAWLRGAARDGMEPETRKPSVGFRCARRDRRSATLSRPRSGVAN